jgi:hypothetical protein
MTKPDQRANANQASDQVYNRGVKMASPIISQERLKAFLSYDPDTGIFRRLISGGGSKVGRIAGCRKCRDGYTRIRVGDRLYLAQRLAWLYQTGQWPVTELDHKNGNRADNRFANLREATPILNGQNRRGPRSDNSHGYWGAKFMPKQGEKPWLARIQVNCKMIYLGYFHTGEQAQAAYLAAKRKLHPFYVGDTP